MRTPRVPACLPWAVLLAATACAPGPARAPGTPAERPAAPPAPAQPPEEPALAPFDGVGRWIAPPCEARPYERVLDVRPDGRFRLEDRVSPCPPDVECVWSGVEVVEGGARTTGATLMLQPDADPGPVRVPDRLVLSRRGERAVLLGDVCPLELETAPTPPGP